jgi:hypothetical protein
VGDEWIFFFRVALNVGSVYEELVLADRVGTCVRACARVCVCGEGMGAVVSNKYSGQVLI